MDFITLDFETATADRNSACELGITIVKDDKICEVKSWLIKPPSYPYFDYFNIAIHGIEPNDVKDAPTFSELWNELHPLLENQFLIAHNASFDMSVLRNTLEYYNIPFPNLQYSCSYIFSKRIWEELPTYNLKSLCNLNNITFSHHRAGADSEATAKLVLAGFKKAGINTLSDFPKKLRTTIGAIFEGGYRPSQARKPFKGKQVEGIIGDSNKINKKSIFYKCVVVFTDEQLSIPRENAYQMIADIGGIVAKNVTKSTDYLIIGRKEFLKDGDKNISKKQKKAIQLIEKGSHLEIISEERLLENLQ